MSFTLSTDSALSPRRVLTANFHSWEGYQASIGDGPARVAYLEALFGAMVGMLMPITVRVAVRIPDEMMLGVARAKAEEMGVKDGVLHVFGEVAHPELDGHELTAEMLPMLASAGEAREAARRVAASLAAGRRYATCHQCGSMFVTQGPRPHVEMCDGCIGEAGRRSGGR